MEQEADFELRDAQVRPSLGLVVLRELLFGLQLDDDSVLHNHVEALCTEEMILEPDLNHQLTNDFVSTFPEYNLQGLLIHVFW